MWYKLTWAPRTFNQSADSAGWVAISYPVFPNIWLGTGGGTTLVDKRTFYPISQAMKNMTGRTFLLSSLLRCHSSWSTSSAGWNTTYRIKIRQRTTNDAWPRSKPCVNVHPVWGGGVGIVDSWDMVAGLSRMICTRHVYVNIKLIQSVVGNRHTMFTLFITPFSWQRPRLIFFTLSLIKTTILHIAICFTTYIQLQVTMSNQSQPTAPLQNSTGKQTPPKRHMKNLMSQR
jgi:hypothetical protein